jgi:hypothetical protein
MRNPLLKLGALRLGLRPPPIPYAKPALVPEQSFEQVAPRYFSGLRAIIRVCILVQLNLSVLHKF